VEVRFWEWRRFGFGMLILLSYQLSAISSQQKPEPSPSAGCKYYFPKFFFLISSEAES
jgi:hypothetical protein